MPLYLIEVKDGDPGRLSWRAVQRLREADAVVVDADLAARFRPVAAFRPSMDAGPGRSGQRVAWVTAHPVVPSGVPWKLCPRFRRERRSARLGLWTAWAWS